MTFLDANVFLDAILDAGQAGKAARTTLLGFDQASPARTSVLVLDEVHWILRKEQGAAAALEASRNLVRSPGLHVVGVEPLHWEVALDFMEKFPELKPRDSLHAAVALDVEPGVIVSTDDNFDVVPGLSRQTPTVA